MTDLSDKTLDTWKREAIVEAESYAVAHDLECHRILQLISSLRASRKEIADWIDLIEEIEFSHFCDACNHNSAIVQDRIEALERKEGK